MQTYQVHHKIGWHLVFFKVQISRFNVFIFFIFGGRGRGLVRPDFYSSDEVQTNRLGTNTANVNVANPKASLAVFQRRRPQSSAGRTVNLTMQYFMCCLLWRTDSGSPSDIHHDSTRRCFKKNKTALSDLIWRV